MADATRVVGAVGKASIERLCLSPYVEKPFKSRVIKSFVPEVRSRYVFFVFRDSYVLCIYVMKILCTFHISVSSYGTARKVNKYIYVYVCMCVFKCKFVVGCCI